MTDTRHWMPPDAPVMFWIGVIACFGFWLVAYALIIKRGFKDKTYGMPLAALCCNFAWEILFSHVFLPLYRLIEYGNTAWVVFDVLIVVTVIKFYKNEITDPFLRKITYVGVVVGIGMAIAFGVPFVKAYGDTQGYFLGWLAALVMSILFIAMLKRRDSVRGQSLYIALAMLFGNIAAFIWVKYMPDQNTLTPTLNLTMMLLTIPFNVAYAVLIYQKLKAEGIDPWKRH